MVIRYTSFAQKNSGIPDVHRFLNIPSALQRVLLDHCIKFLPAYDWQLFRLVHFSLPLLDTINQGDKTAWDAFAHDINAALFQAAGSIVDHLTQAVYFYEKSKLRTF